MKFGSLHFLPHGSPITKEADRNLLGLSPCTAPSASLLLMDKSVIHSVNSLRGTSTIECLNSLQPKTNRNTSAVEQIGSNACCRQRECTTRGTVGHLCKRQLESTYKFLTVLGILGESSRQVLLFGIGCSQETKIIL